MKRWTTSGGITIERLNTLKCNCYVIQCAGAVYLVDTSVVMERQSIERQLKKLGISGLDGIILTHVIPIMWEMLPVFKRNSIVWSTYMLMSGQRFGTAAARCPGERFPLPKKL